MALHSDQTRPRAPMDVKRAGSTMDESDSQYRLTEEAGSVDSGSQSSADEVSSSSSSSDHGKGEMRSKKRHDPGCMAQEVGSGSRERGKDRAEKRGRGKEGVGHGKGVEVKGKGKVEEVRRRGRYEEGDEGGREKAVDGEIRHRYSFDAIYALNEQLEDIQKEVIRGTVGIQCWRTENS